MATLDPYVKRMFFECSHSVVDAFVFFWIDGWAALRPSHCFGYIIACLHICRHQINNNCANYCQSVTNIHNSRLDLIQHVYVEFDDSDRIINYNFEIARHLSPKAKK